MVRGCCSLLIFAFVSPSQKLAITPVNSVASSTNTTLPTKNTWRCTHPSVSILLEIRSLADCDLLWLNMRVAGESSLWILPRDLWDGSWQDIDLVLTTAKPSWNLLSEGHLLSGL